MFLRILLLFAENKNFKISKLLIEIGKNFCLKKILKN